jgi:hypothetical protein
MKHFILCGMLVLASLLPVSAQTTEEKSYLDARIEHGDLDKMKPSERAVILALKKAIANDDTFVETPQCTVCLVVVPSIVESRTVGGDVIGIVIGFSIVFQNSSLYPTHLLTGVLTGGTSQKDIDTNAAELVIALHDGLKELALIVARQKQLDKAASTTAPLRKKV